MPIIASVEKVLVTTYASGYRWPNQGQSCSFITASADISLHLMQDAGLVTAAAFSPAGNQLAAVTSMCRLVVWDVAPASLSRWSQQNMHQPPDALLSLPGVPSHISFNPDPKVCGSNRTISGCLPSHPDGLQLSVMQMDREVA